MAEKRDVRELIAVLKDKNIRDRISEMANALQRFHYRELEAESADVKTENADWKAESADRKTESADRKAESADRKAESTDRQTESADRKAESADRQTESADRKAESADQETRSIDQKLEEKEGRLWLTDDAACAEKLSRLGLPFLVLFHEKNRQESFSCAKFAMELSEELDEEYLEQVYRRCKKIPWDIVETKRCLIRETTVDDMEQLLEIYKDPKMTQYTDHFCPPNVDAGQYIRDYVSNVYEFYGYGIWTILCRETGKVIGRAGFSLLPEEEDPQIGYMVGVPWQGKGIAAEVCEEILKYGKEVLLFERVNALIDKRNKASIALCKKLGFREAGMGVHTGHECICFEWKA